MCLCGRRTARRRCAECARNSTRHETAVRDALEADHRLRGFVWDARAAGRCTRRPDFLWTFERSCVALEVDENEHASYDPADERARVEEIERALGRPVSWVRVRVAPGASRDDTEAAVVDAADVIADVVFSARKKTGGSKIKNVTIAVK